MFKKIQKDLLITNPILWNTKIVPFLAVIILFHLLFLSLGYLSTSIDFTSEYSNYYDSEYTYILVFFSILISILILILWMIFYTRNNGFKSFYPKNTTALYKEWLLILLICILNSTYYLSINTGQNLKKRSYISKEEVVKRSEIISMSSLFADAAFEAPDRKYINTDSTSIAIVIDTIQYRGEKYAYRSLFNKKIDSDSYIQETKDSLNTIKIKNWLYENQKDSVQNLMDSFFQIAAKYNMKSNITSKEWLQKTYDFPNFDSYTIIFKSKNSYYNDDPAVSITASATEEKTRSRESYYVPYNILKQSHSKIQEAWQNPLIDYGITLSLLYVGFGLSLLIFSYKVTSGREWLIALIALGIISIIFGFITILGRFSSLYPMLWVLLTIGLLISFLTTVFSSQKKGISGIILNSLLWLILGLLPLLYLLITELFNIKNIQYDENGNSIYVPQSTVYSWMKEYCFHFMIANLFIIMISIYFLSILIKKWKGIAEA